MASIEPATVLGERCTPPSKESALPLFLSLEEFVSDWMTCIQQSSRCVLWCTVHVGPLIIKAAMLSPIASAHSAAWQKLALKLTPSCLQQEACKQELEIHRTCSQPWLQQQNTAFLKYVSIGDHLQHVLEELPLVYRLPSRIEFCLRGTRKFFAIDELDDSRLQTGLYTQAIALEGHSVACTHLDGNLCTIPDATIDPSKGTLAQQGAQQNIIKGLLLGHDDSWPPSLIVLNILQDA